MQASGGDSAISYSGLDIRSVLDALIVSEGAIGLGSLRVSQRAGGPDFSVDVAAGFCAITGDDVALQGKYLCQNTAVVNLAIPSPPVSGSLVHRVIARVKDKTHNGSWSTYEWTLEVLPDIGSGTPALPATAITLALVTVAFTATNVVDGNITNQPVSAFLWPTRPHQVASDAARPPNPGLFERVGRTDKAPIEQVFDGSAWRMDGSAATIFKERGSDLSRTSTTALADDTDLTATLLAGVVYQVDIVLYYTASTTGDFRFQFLVPTNGDLRAHCGALPSGSTGNSGDVSQDKMSAGSAFIGGGNGATAMTARVMGTVWSGDGGTFKLQWAQSVSDGTATILKQSSSMILRPVS
jgi:hypothetical protein